MHAKVLPSWHRHGNRPLPTHLAVPGGPEVAAALVLQTSWQEKEDWWRLSTAAKHSHTHTHTHTLTHSHTHTHTLSHTHTHFRMGDTRQLYSSCCSLEMPKISWLWLKVRELRGDFPEAAGTLGAIHAGFFFSSVLSCSHKGWKEGLGGSSCWSALLKHLQNLTAAVWKACALPPCLSTLSGSLSLCCWRVCPAFQHVSV